MKALGRKAIAAVAFLAVSGFVSGCGGGDERNGNHQIWFMGSIFNGATGAVVTDYQISLTYGKTTVNGTVDMMTGRYTLGPLPAWNDYAVSITSYGYRLFNSYNAGISPPTPPPASQASDVYNASTMQTFDFDAYLFPDAVQPAAVTISIVKPDPTATPAAGSIRLRPISLPSIQDQPAGVGNQVWSNDQDLLAATINRDFSYGAAMIEGSALVYGVTYQVAVYNVEGFAPMNSSTVRAGFQEAAMVNLTTTTAAPLTLASSTMTNCRAIGASTTVTNTAQITFTFSVPIEDATPPVGGAGVPGGPEMLDNGLTVSTQMSNVLRTSASPLVQERGTSFLISGSQLTIFWNASGAYLNQLAGDLITSVSYGNISQIQLRPAGQPTLARTLSSMLPNTPSSIPCNQ
jgi:hypothetical protein